MEREIQMLTPLEITAAAVHALDAKMAKDIKVLHTTERTILADYFVICTATSSTHVKTLTDECDKALSDLGAARGLPRRGLDTARFWQRHRACLPEGGARVL